MKLKKLKNKYLNKRKKYCKIPAFERYMKKIAFEIIKAHMKSIKNLKIISTPTIDGKMWRESFSDIVDTYRYAWGTPFLPEAIMQRDISIQNINPKDKEVLQLARNISHSSKLNLNEGIDIVYEAIEYEKLGKPSLLIYLKTSMFDIEEYRIMKEMI